MRRTVVIEDGPNLLAIQAIGSLEARSRIKRAPHSRNRRGSNRIRARRLYWKAKKN